MVKIYRRDRLKYAKLYFVHNNAMQDMTMFYQKIRKQAESEDMRLATYSSGLALSRLRSASLYV